MGRSKDLVYRLLCASTIDEKIAELLKQKADKF